ncbi:MAG: beta-N-acetylhexosaminidase [Bacillota bacterium]
MKKSPWLVALVVLGFLTTGCVRVANPSPSQPPAVGVDQLIAKMTAEEKVAQLFMVGFDGKSVPASMEALIKQGVGGAILFARNIDSPEQTAQLTNRLQELTQQSISKVPLLVSIDQEHGIVSRFSQGFTVYPGQMALGATRSETMARTMGEVTGRELRALGINMNLAPVLDVNNNAENPVIGVRSFGEDPQMVAKMGTQIIAGLQSQRVAAVGKHFPGHGDTSVDSHKALPVVAHPRTRLNSTELVPFKAAIAAGVDAIMTAHVFFPAIESNPDLPATLSSSVLTGLLRQELGFKGVIITDDMEMKAISDRYTPGEAAIKALQAGTDIVLIASQPTHHQAALQAVQKAVADGQISKERLDQSVRRILELKQRYGLLAAQKVDLTKVKELVGTTAHRQQAQAVADKSITLIRDQSKLLAAKLELSGKVVVIDNKAGVTNPTAIYSALKQRVPQAVSILWDVNPSESQVTQALAAAKDADLVIVASHNAHLNSGQAAAIRRVLALNRPTIVAALRNPYDASALPEAKTVIATYSYQEVSMNALARFLSFEITTGFSGQLPVTLH